MKVFIICTEPFPNGAAATKRILCYARALMLAGVPCSVLIYKWTEKDGTRNTSSCGTHLDVPFRYTGGSPLKPSRKVARIWSEWYGRHRLKAFLRKNLEKGDVVLGYVPSDFSFVGKLVGITHSKGAKYVRELCEIPYYGNSDEGLKNVLERDFPKFDGFISISDSLTRVALKYKRDDAKVLQLPILVDYEATAMEDRSQNEEIPFIFHCGTLYEQKDGIKGMLEAFASAREKYGKPMRLIFAGKPEDSPDKAMIMETVSRHGLADSVIFTGYLMNDSIADYLSRAFAVMINKHDNPQNRYGFSTKLGEYLAAGKAVIISDVGEVMNWLENGKSALVVKREDVGGMADAILLTLSDIETRKRIGEGGRAVCRDNFDYKKVSGKLAGFLKGL